MKPIVTVLSTAGAIAVSIFAIVAIADGGNTTPTTVSAQDQLERGRYIVHGVGLCIDCHTPHNERGEPVVEKQLQGSALPFAPTVPMPFVGVAPRIAGLPAGYSAEDMVHFLMTGTRPRGLPPVLPPMPPYRLNRGDAEAVVAYVKSLPSGLD
jgi:mono/diheme cytochrome c family protein